MKLAANRFVAESYFEFYSDKASAGAINTGKKLFSKYPGRPGVPQLMASLQGPMPTCAAAEEIEKRLELLVFGQWIQQLRLGINLALYGYGSKGSLLLRFVLPLQDEGYHVFWVKTFDTSTSGGPTSPLQAIQTVIKKVLPGLDRLGRNMREASDILSTHMAQEPGMKIALLVEMADAPTWRSADTWTALGRLAQLRSFRMLLTFEHVNASLLGDAHSWATLSLAWHNVTSLRPYGLELSALHGLGSRDVDVGESKFQGAKFVLGNLTQTARSVYRVLLEYQMGRFESKTGDASDEDDLTEENGEGVHREEESMGLSLISWYQRCQEQFLVSNEMAFRTQLAEFIDHELVRATDDLGQHGNFFVAPFERTLLEELASFLTGTAYKDNAT